MSLFQLARDLQRVDEAFLRHHSLGILLWFFVTVHRHADVVQTLEFCDVLERHRHFKTIQVERVRSLLVVGNTFWVRIVRVVVDACNYAPEETEIVRILDVEDSVFF